MAAVHRSTFAKAPCRPAVSKRSVKARSRVVRGPAYVVKDNIDTDQIIPAEYLTLVPTKVRGPCLERVIFVMSSERMKLRALSVDRNYRIKSNAF